MKTTIWIIGALLLVGITTATTCELSEQAGQYVEDNHLSIPTTEWGCNALNNKFTLNDKQCWWTRERDGMQFKGIMGLYKDGSYRCFSPGRRNTQPIQAPIVDTTPHVPTCTTTCVNVTTTSDPIHHHDFHGCPTGWRIKCSQWVHHHCEYFVCQGTTRQCNTVCS